MKSGSKYLNLNFKMNVLYITNLLTLASLTFCDQQPSDYNSSNTFLGMNPQNNIFVKATPNPLSLSNPGSPVNLNFPMPNNNLNPPFANPIPNQNNNIFNPTFPGQNTIFNNGPFNSLVSPKIIGSYTEPSLEEQGICSPKQSCISCQNALYNLKFKENAECEFNKCVGKVS